MLNTATVPINVNEGGTGIASTTTYTPICAGTTTTGAFQSVASLATSGFILISNGAASLPTFQAKNTVLVGSSTNDNATTGNIGEWITAAVASGSAISMSTVTVTNITSISLTAGDWDVYAQVAFKGTTTTKVVYRQGGISIANNTLSNVASMNTSIFSVTQDTGGIIPGSNVDTFNTAPCRQSLSGTTTIYLNANASFSVSTMTCYGYISAIRVR